MDRFALEIERSTLPRDLRAPAWFPIDQWGGLVDCGRNRALRGMSGGGLGKDDLANFKSGKLERRSSFIHPLTWTRLLQSFRLMQANCKKTIGDRVEEMHRQVLTDDWACFAFSNQSEFDTVQAMTKIF